MKKLLDDAGFATAAALNDVQSQVNALNEFKKSVEALDPIVDQTWKEAVDAAIASLEGIKADIAAKADASALEGKADKGVVDELKGKMEEAEKSINALNELKIGEKLASIGANIDLLNIFVKRDLKSLVLRPNVYFGGIEGVGVYIFKLPVEKPNKDIDNKALACNNVDPAYRYFDRSGS